MRDAPPPATPVPAGPPVLAVQPGPRPVIDERVSLVDLLDRVLADGVVIVGDVRLSIADVDLVAISLRALISSVGTVAAAGALAPADAPSPASPASRALPVTGGPAS